MLGGAKSMRGERKMIYKEIRFKASPFLYELFFEDRITLVGGDSGTGKTVLYEMLEDLRLTEEYLKNFSMTDALTVKQRFEENARRKAEYEATKVLSADAVTADIDVHNGVFEATAWGCDLTHDYVTINADYRS